MKSAPKFKPHQSVLLVVAAVLVCAPLLVGGVLHGISVLFFVYYTALLIPCVVGMYCLIMLGLFDLSAGAIAALAGVSFAILSTSGFPLYFSVALGLISGLVVGVANWIMVSQLRIPALIATLISMMGARGLCLLLTSGRVVGGVPNVADGGVVFGVPLQIWIAIGIAIIVVVVMFGLEHKHFFVRRLRHVGSNRVAAFRNGVDVNAIDLFAFLACAAGASTVGILQSLRTQSASPIAFQDLALDAIAACVIGRMSIAGGRGTVLGCTCGAFAIVGCRSLIQLAGVDVYWQDVALALLLLASAILGRR